MSERKPMQRKVGKSKPSLKKIVENKIETLVSLKVETTDSSNSSETSDDSMSLTESREDNTIDKSSLKPKKISALPNPKKKTKKISDKYLASSPTSKSKLSSKSSFKSCEVEQTMRNKEKLDNADKGENLVKHEDFTCLKKLSESENQSQLSSGLIEQLTESSGKNEQISSKHPKARRLYHSEVELPGFLNQNITLNMDGHNLIVTAYRPKNKFRNARKVTEIVEIPSYVDIENLKIGRRPDGILWIEEWVMDIEEQLRKEMNPYLTEDFPNTDPEVIAAAVVGGIQGGLLPAKKK